MLKIQFIRPHLVDYFKSHTQISKVSPNDSTEKDLINFYLGHKASFAFARLAKLNTPSIKIDMTREISDANSFLIDGLSLVAECFLFQNVDWSLGGQYLHFIYTFERYIEMFSSLTDFYYIVFFRDMDKSLVSHDSSFYLALNIVYNHWSNMANKSKIKFFTSMLDEKYKEFLAQQKPTFVVIDERSLDKLLWDEAKRTDLISVIIILLTSLNIRPLFNLRLLLRKIYLKQR
jgi:hypothetical protein